jgi:hypothetical protein
MQTERKLMRMYLTIMLNRVFLAHVTAPFILSEHGIDMSLIRPKTRAAKRIIGIAMRFDMPPDSSSFSRNSLI